MTVVVPIFFYTTDTLKDDDGDDLGAHPRINGSFLGPGVVWVTNVKVLGGNLGGQILPIACTPIPRITTIGLAYYTQVKASADSSGLGLGFLQDRKDHAFGIGVEGSVFLPNQKGNTKLAGPLVIDAPPARGRFLRRQHRRRLPDAARHAERHVEVSRRRSL